MNILFLGQNKIFKACVETLFQSMNKENITIFDFIGAVNDFNCK